MEDAPRIVVDWRARAWAALSRVPFTGPWRRYRDTVRWLDESHAFIASVVADAPAWPRPLPRHAAIIDYVTGCMTALLEGTRAAERGADRASVQAVISEHRPDQPPVFVQ